MDPAGYLMSRVGIGDTLVILDRVRPRTAPTAPVIRPECLDQSTRLSAVPERNNKPLQRGALVRENNGTVGKRDQPAWLRSAGTTETVTGDAGYVKALWKHLIERRNRPSVLYPADV